MTDVVRSVDQVCAWLENVATMRDCIRVGATLGRALNKHGFSGRAVVDAILGTPSSSSSTKPPPTQPLPAEPATNPATPPPAAPGDRGRRG